LCGAALFFTVPEVRVLLCVVLAAVGWGCGKNEEEPPAQAERAPGVAVQAKKPLEAALTVERMVAAKGGLRPYDPWDKAWAHLVATVGEPTASEGDVFRWTLLVGETCHVLEVRRAEDRVDGVLYGPYEKGSPQHEWCAAPGK
jgi:hypothetical protein